jgi:signal transduction histidine kinase
MNALESQNQVFRWIVWLRWACIATAVLLVLTLEGRKPDSFFLGVWAIILVAGIYNLILHLLSGFPRLAYILTLLSLLIDGLLISWWMTITGGPMSSCIPFYLFVIMGACLVSSPRIAVLIALFQIGIFIGTLWICYDYRPMSDLAASNYNLFYKVLEETPPEIRRNIYLQQGVRWTFFFIITTLICVLLVRQVWHREERLRARERAMEQKRRLIQMGDLTSRIAHSVNTSLGLILGNLDLWMDETRKGGKTYKHIAEIERYVQRAIGSVRGMLHYSRQNLSEITSVSFPKVIQAAVSSIQPRLKKSRAKLVLDVDSRLPEIMAYPEGVYQVILNLLENAVDSIHSGGIITLSAHFRFRALRLSAADQRGEIKLVVRDTGKGIPASELKRVFEPFYSTKGFGKGTGLGLSIVKRIVEEHRGEISVESRPEEGTVFTVLFPTDAWNREKTNRLGHFDYNETSENKKET